MTIQELANEANVTVRTIRYYVEQGLLPAPERGRYAEYTQEHVKRLAFIAQLKAHFLPLDEIRSMLQKLSGPDIEQYLASTKSQAATESGLSSAADYITSVLQRGATRTQLKQYAPMSPPAASPAVAPGSLATHSSREAAGASAQRAYSRMPPVKIDRTPVESEQTWRRIPLVEGVELHYALPASAKVREIVAQIVVLVETTAGAEPIVHTEEHENETDK